MAKVITFSRQFPAYHPRKGEPTYFVEKVWKSLYVDGVCPDELNQYINNYDKSIKGDFLPYNETLPKGHTIRGGSRWKKGDYFSPAVWGDNINIKNGRRGPYQSNQVKFAPDTKIVKTWGFELINDKVVLNGLFHCKISDFGKMLSLSQNDGLSVDDMLHWFKYPKPIIDHQIICWNENIVY